MPASHRGPGCCQAPEGPYSPALSKSILDMNHELARLTVTEEFIEAVSREGNNLQTLLDALPECVKVLRPEGVITYVNRAGLESFGTRCADQVVGQSILQFVAPGYHEIYREKMLKVLNGESVSLVYETSACNSGVLRWVRSKMAPLRNDQGKVTFLLAITRDITERKRMEERLEDYEIQLRTIIDSEPEGVVLHSKDGGIMDVNPAARAMLHLQSDCGVGESIYRFMDKKYRSAYEQLIHKVFSGEKGRIEMKTDPAIASPRWVEIHAAPLCNSRSETVALLGIVEDITDRKTREERVTEKTMQVAHVHRLNVMRELSRLIAHEINQPLCAISSYTEMCRQILDGNKIDMDSVCELVDLVAVHTNRVNDVIRKMRELVRKRPMQREFVDPVKLLVGAAEMFEPIFRKNGIVMELIRPDVYPDVYVDPIQIEQVLASLMRNSIQALGRINGDRRFTIRLCNSDDKASVMVSVEDNGPGIPKKVRENVLKPFFTSEGHGVGLGLSLSRYIIELHGGKFWIENLGPGQGAGVHFALPVAGEKET